MAWTNHTDVVLRKDCLKITICRQTTIEESIFASDDKDLKVIFIYKKWNKKNGCVRVTKNSWEL
jgi:hypothetical protein